MGPSICASRTIVRNVGNCRSVKSLITMVHTWPLLELLPLLLYLVLILYPLQVNCFFHFLLVAFLSSLEALKILVIVTPVIL